MLAALSMQTLTSPSSQPLCNHRARNLPSLLTQIPFFFLEVLLGEKLNATINRDLTLIWNQSSMCIINAKQRSVVYLDDKRQRDVQYIYYLSVEQTVTDSTDTYPTLRHITMCFLTVPVKISKTQTVLASITISPSYTYLFLENPFIFHNCKLEMNDSTTRISQHHSDSHLSTEYTMFIQKSFYCLFQIQPTI